MLLAPCRAVKLDMVFPAWRGKGLFDRRLG
jgi:hypothetical protein